MGRIGCILVWVVLFVNTQLAAVDLKGRKINTVEGLYQVHSIAPHIGFTEIRFEKYPEKKGNKAIVLEVSSLTQTLVHKGAVLDITAQVMESSDNVLEANQILLSPPRQNGKMKVWLLSRKSNGILNFENVSLLKMQGTVKDYHIL